MKEETLRLRRKLRQVLLCALMAGLFISCAPGAKVQERQKVQEGQGNGVGSSSGKKSSSDRSAQKQDAESPEPVETRLTRLFDLCKSGKVEDAATYFVYRGEDKSREWRDTLRADDPAERGAIRDICTRIKSYLDASSGYSFDAVKVERESEGEWHAVEVSFQQGEQKKKAIFAFLLVKGQYAIGDID